MKLRLLLFVAVGATLMLLSACGSDGSSGGNITVIDWLGTLNEGESMTWSLDPGTYRLEMTSSPYGSSVTWTPSTGCQNYGEVTAYAQNCTLTINGQIRIANPTTLGLGPSESVTVIATKM